MRVNTNPIEGSQMGNYLNAYSGEIQKSLARMTSGMRVFQPSEDPAAYFKGEALGTRAESTRSASRLLETHVSRVQAADSYLKEVRTMLGDMAQLALKASNESDTDVRTNYGKEFDQKITALGKFLDSASYDGATLFKGAYDSDAGGKAFSAQISEMPSDSKYTYDILDTRYDESTGLNLDNYKTGETDWGNAGAGQTNAANYYKALTEEDSGMVRIDRNSNRLATHLTVLKGASNALDVKATNYEAARSALVSVNDAEESSRLSSLQIRRQVAASFLAQNNVSQSQVIGLLAHGSFN